jgi:hypothetical protein
MDWWEEKHWSYQPFSVLQNHRPAEKKTRWHRCFQPRLAATEGVSVVGHRICCASLHVSMLITAGNIRYSYVGVSSIDIPQNV